MQAGQQRPRPHGWGAGGNGRIEETVSQHDFNNVSFFLMI